MTQVLNPTSGTIAIEGRLSPLLQIGTGFHGDFTGRQNVYSSLAHQGVVGKDAHALFDGILAFAELDEYIDQPMKTYSTGMVARLMFSTATAILPDILVVDELLGVGDGYFSQKSFDRMRQMCSRNGTTLLLVTHDLYAALNLCERFIWIDSGRVMIDGDGQSTVHAYEASIKAQEEERLRRRHLASVPVAADRVGGLRVAVRSQSGFALDAPLALASLVVGYADGARVALEVADGHPSWLLVPENNLGFATVIDGRRCRVLNTFGSIYHKAEWAVSLPRGEGLAELSIEYAFGGSEPFELTVQADDQRVLLRELLGAGEGWQRRVLPMTEAGPPTATLPTSGQYGTGLMRIHGVRFVDADGQPVVKATHGAPLSIEVEIAVQSPDASREPTFAIVFMRAGSSASAYVQTDRLELPAGDRFRVVARFDAVVLGSGDWQLTVGLAEPDYYLQPWNEYFTVNARWYHIISRGVDLRIDSVRSIDPAAFVVLPVTLTVEPLGTAL